MALAADSTTSNCNNCDKAIPSSNIHLHIVHCLRNLEKCRVCGDMIHIKDAAKHFLKTHAPVDCSLCNEKIDRKVLSLHKRENCSQRIIACTYCDFPLPAAALYEHKELCGNRTELCLLCNKYIRIREQGRHASICNIDNLQEASRYTRAAERDQNPHTRQPNDLSPKHLFLTIAFTGMGVLFGALFFKPKQNQGH